MSAHDRIARFGTVRACAESIVEATVHSCRHGADSRSRNTGHGFEPSFRAVEHGFESLKRSAEHGFKSLKRSAEHGFTLIELMVALAVFSIAALALLRLEGATLSSTANLSDRTIGQIVARNLAVEALTDPVPPTFGETRGREENSGRVWNWTRRSARATEINLQQIDIAVADDTGQPAGALTVFRPLQQ